MTVMKLTAAQKAAVVVIYTSNIRPSSMQHLAAILCVSTRTIGRVIEEAGVIASKKVHTGEAAAVMRLLYKHKMTVDQLENLLGTLPTKTVELLTQTKRSKKSPTGHNGKQTLLLLTLPTSLELH